MEDKELHKLKKQILNLEEKFNQHLEKHNDEKKEYDKVWSNFKTKWEAAGLGPFPY